MCIGTAGGGLGHGFDSDLCLLRTLRGRATEILIPPFTISCRERLPFFPLPLGEGWGEGHFKVLHTPHPIHLPLGEATTGASAVHKYPPLPSPFAPSNTS